MNNSVVPYDPAWTAAFADEAEAVKAVLQKSLIEIQHIGSTAIPGILAKPIIDMLCLVTSLEEVDRSSGSIEKLGYEVMGAFGIDGRRYFRKINASGKRTHHLHAFEVGSEHIERHIAFRDYLRSHPAKAAQYSALKESLLNGKATTWETYLEGKSPFIVATEADAVAWYRESKRAPEAP